jgi:hypothetical protein
LLPAFTRRNCYFRVIIAPGVESIKHSPLGTIAVVSIIGTLCFFGPTTRGTTLRLIDKAFRLKELLFPGAKGKRSAAIGALDGLVLKNHWMTSSLYNQLEFGSSNTLENFV